MKGKDENQECRDAIEKALQKAGVKDCTKVKCEFLDKGMFGDKRLTIREVDLVDLQKEYADVYDGAHTKKRVALYKDIIRMKYDDKTIYQNATPVKENIDKIYNVEAYKHKLEREKESERGKSIMNNEKDFGIQVLVTASEKLLKRDITTADGTRTFNVLTLPAGLIVDGRDLSYYQLFVEKAYRNDGPFASIPVYQNKEYPLRKDIKDKETGEYKPTYEKVTGIKLAIAMDKNYKKYKAAQVQKEATKEAEPERTMGR